MAALTHKVQVLLTDEQHRELLALAEARGKPLSVLLREALVEQLLKEARRERKLKAAEAIAAMDLPVAEWDEVEKEIEEIHAGVRKSPR